MCRVWCVAHEACQISVGKLRCQGRTHPRVYVTVYIGKCRLARLRCNEGVVSLSRPVLPAWAVPSQCGSLLLSACMWVWLVCAPKLRKQGSAILGACHHPMWAASRAGIDMSPLSSVPTLALLAPRVGLGSALAKYSPRPNRRVHCVRAGHRLLR